MELVNIRRFVLDFEKIKNKLMLIDARAIASGGGETKEFQGDQKLPALFIKLSLRKG